ncbi:MAG: hypothetical protein JNL05_02990 [Flavobacteriales bacterium]|nr:hypothetical protein [Flavobacteriales bacterium]
MDQGIRNPALHLLVHGHVWLAFGAAAQTWLLQDLMDLGGWQAPVVAALVTFAGYTAMRMARAMDPAVQQAPIMEWTWAHRRALITAAVIAVIVVCAVALHRLFPLLRAFWPVALAVVLYAVPVRRAAGDAPGLRRAPLLKAFLIAGSWAWVTVGLPVVFKDGDAEQQGLGWLFAMQAAFFLAITLVFDLRDREHDRGKVLTWPHVLGDRLTRVLAVLLMLYPATVFGLLAYIGHAMSAMEGASAWPLDRVLAALGYLTAAVVVASSKAQRPALHYALVVDGLLLLVPLLYAIGRCV